MKNINTFLLLFCTSLSFSALSGSFAHKASDNIPLLEATLPGEYCKSAKKGLKSYQKEPAYLAMLILSCDLEEEYWSLQIGDSIEVKKVNDYLKLWNDVQKRRISVEEMGSQNYVRMYRAKDRLDKQLGHMSVPRSNLLTAFVSSMKHHDVQINKSSHLRMTLALLDCGTVDAGMETFSKEVIDQITENKSANAPEILSQLLNFENDFNQIGASRDCLAGFKRAPLNLFADALLYLELSRFNDEDKSAATILELLKSAIVVKSKEMSAKKLSSKETKAWKRTQRSYQELEKLVAMYATPLSKSPL